jgi:hypothetical protein
LQSPHQLADETFNFVPAKWRKTTTEYERHPSKAIYVVVCSFNSSSLPDNDITTRSVLGNSLQCAIFVECIQLFPSFSSKLHAVVLFGYKKGKVQYSMCQFCRLWERRENSLLSGWWDDWLSVATSLRVSPPSPHNATNELVSQGNLIRSIPKSWTVIWILDEQSRRGAVQNGLMAVSHLEVLVHQ